VKPTLAPIQPFFSAVFSAYNRDFRTSTGHDGRSARHLEIPNG
jgi:hypothetical protein